MSAAPFILTRPNGGNAPVAAALAALGVAPERIWDWPAFAIVPPPDAAAARAALSPERVRAAGFVDFVSPAAVEAAREILPEWPEGVVLAAAGEGTLRAARAAWGEGFEAVCPAGGARGSGSETLWPEIERRGVPGRAIIVRGVRGREWLPERLRAAGCLVETVAVYDRAPLALSPEAARAVARALLGISPVAYVTSSEAVGVLLEAVAEIPGAANWLRCGWALAIHARIGERLRQEGFRRVRLVEPDPGTVARAMREMAASCGLAG